MDFPPSIRSDSGSAGGELLSAVCRSAVAILFGIIGFWFILWYDRRLDNSDTRLGMVKFFTLPVIGVFAARATQAIILTSTARTLVSCLRSPLLLVLIVLCWSPFGCLIGLFVVFAVALVSKLRPLAILLGWMPGSCSFLHPTVLGPAPLTTGVRR